MNHYIIKIIITTTLIVVISEISKRSSLISAILASVPLVSVLAMIWLYHDTKDISKISELSIAVFWLVLPSLALFVSLPVLLKQGISFYLSLLIAIMLTIACYYGMIVGLRYLGIKL